MNSKAHITTEFPTEKEVASRLRLSPARVAVLRKQLDDLYITHPDGIATVVEINNGPAGKRRANRKSRKR